MQFQVMMKMVLTIQTHVHSHTEEVGKGASKQMSWYNYIFVI